MRRRPIPFEEKTLVLGIGAQKAGTSWLFSYLAGRREVYLSPLKELHYFDLKYRPELSGRNRQAMAWQLAAWERSPWSRIRNARPLGHLRERLAMTADTSSYADYFRRHVPDDVSIYGEITPAYATLPREGFEDIARHFGRVKLVFVMRDPVDRLHAQFRMRLAAAAANGDELPNFRAALDDAAYIERTRYDRTITTLRSEFAPNQVHIAFYETLFCDAEIARLCAFLDIAFKPGRYTKKINSSAPSPLEPADAALARERCDGIYRFCRTTFGERIPATWRP